LSLLTTQPPKYVAEHDLPASTAPMGREILTPISLIHNRPYADGAASRPRMTTGLRLRERSIHRPACSAHDHQTD
jgi:hypothetical protein